MHHSFNFCAALECGIALAHTLQALETVPQEGEQEYELAYLQVGGRGAGRKGGAYFLLQRCAAPRR